MTLEQIEQVLDAKVRPMLHSHGGEVHVVAFQDGVLHVTLTGACAGCPSADLNTRGFIEDTLRTELPALQRVELEHTVGEELLDFARQLLHRGNEKWNGL